MLLLLLALLPGAAVANTPAPPSVQLALDRPSAQVGEIVKLTVSLTGGVDIYGSAVDVTFDNTLLQFVPEASSAQGLVTASGTLPPDQYYINFLQAVNGTQERRSAIALRLGNQPGASGDGLLGVFAFKALREGSAVFALDGAAVGVQLVDSTGAAISFTPATGSVTLTVGGPASGTGSIVGKVQFQGRGPDRWAGAVVKVAGGQVSAVTAADGTFNLAGLPAGTYRLYIVAPGYLSALTDPVTVTAGTVATVNPITIRAGDASGDNQVSLTDLVILAQTYGLRSGDSGYDGRADFNADGSVGLIDLALLAANYGQAGASQ